MQVGTNYITDKKEVDVTLANGAKEKQYWYQFRIPISQYSDKVGDIPDFKSIRFVRLFMTDFEDSTVLRFAKFEMVRNNWRSFTYELDTSSKYIPVVADNVSMFNVSAVNIEENDKRVPIPYRVPPGIQRVQALSNGGINILQNEQSMSLAFTNLKNGLNNAKAVFKNVNLDLRQYKKLSMFIHAESKGSSTAVKDGELYAVFRIGNDFISNFYEIRYPLKVTPWNTTDEEVIWPLDNRMDLDIRSLVKLKAERNAANASVSQIYSTKDAVNGKTISIVGNPNMGEVRGILVGVENGSASTDMLNAEIWVNELRLSGIDENDAWAGVGQLNLQLADLGTLSVAGSMHTTGFGALEQRVNERFREDLKQIDIATNLQLGKLLPKPWGLEIPFFASYSQMSMAPQYDPYDKDILLKDKLRVFRDKRDSIRNDAEDFTSIKTINFTNVRKAPGKKIKLWSISNFDFSYAFTQTLQHSPLVELNDLKRHQGGIGYTYAGKPKYFEPFKKMIKSKSRTLDFIKNINVNYIPNLLNARFDGRRQFGAIRPRNVGGGPYKIPETYDKYFVFDRLYNMRWDLTRSLNIDFKALNNSRIDEPFGRIDTKSKKDSIMSNILKGGRNTLYTQSMDMNYNLPTNIIPFLDWTTLSLTYRTTYNWIGASRLAVSLGNTIQNSYAKGATAELNMTQLYNKWRLLRSLGQPTAKKLQPNQNASQNNKTDKKEKDDK
ncbi:MAG: cell surface protein SprA, partial [Chitinophagaceae bacterium]